MKQTIIFHHMINVSILPYFYHLLQIYEKPIIKSLMDWASNLTHHPTHSKHLYFYKHSHKTQEQTIS